VIEVKAFSQADNKKHMRQRVHLSDGTSIVIAMITDKVEQQLIDAAEEKVD